MAKNLPSKIFIRQIKADLIGKDAYRGVSLSYAWLVNQFGHFALGFIPSFLLNLLLQHIGTTSPFLAATCVSLFWLSFECYNFIGPLLLNRMSQASRFYMATSTYVFRPAWSNVAYDTFTDVIFFVFGAFSFAFALTLHFYVVVLLFLLSLYLIYASNYWYSTKIFLQNAEFPFQFRLSQWDNPISELNKQKINQFVQSNQPEHLLLYGPHRCGKTSLAIGIGTELAIKHQKCIYITASKMLSILTENWAKDANKLWYLEEAEVIIIDDVNPGYAFKRQFLEPADFDYFLYENESYVERNIQFLRDRKFIWVLGNSSSQSSWWEHFLTTKNIAATQVHSINLFSKN